MARYTSILLVSCLGIAQAVALEDASSLIQGALEAKVDDEPLEARALGATKKAVRNYVAATNAQEAEASRSSRVSQATLSAKAQQSMQRKAAKAKKIQAVHEMKEAEAQAIAEKKDISDAKKTIENANIKVKLGEREIKEMEKLKTENEKEKDRLNAITNEKMTHRQQTKAMSDFLHKTTEAQRIEAAGQPVLKAITPELEAALKEIDASMQGTINAAQNRLVEATATFMVDTKAAIDEGVKEIEATSDTKRIVQRMVDTIKTLELSYKPLEEASLKQSNYVKHTLPKEVAAQLPEAILLPLSQKSKVERLDLNSDEVNATNVCEWTSGVLAKMSPHFTRAVEAHKALNATAALVEGDAGAAGSVLHDLHAMSLAETIGWEEVGKNIMLTAAPAVMKKTGCAFSAAASPRLGASLLVAVLAMAGRFFL